LLNRYQAIAPKEKLDPLGSGFVPLGYAAGQVLHEAVKGAKTLGQGSSRNTCTPTASTW
jgi:hypothetical protein